MSAVEKGLLDDAAKFVTEAATKHGPKVARAVKEAADKHAPETMKAVRDAAIGAAKAAPDAVKEIGVAALGPHVRRIARNSALAGAGAGAVVGGASGAAVATHHAHRKARKAAAKGGVAKSAFGVEHEGIAKDDRKKRKPGYLAASVMGATSVAHGGFAAHSMHQARKHTWAARKEEHESDQLRFIGRKLTPFQRMASGVGPAAARHELNAMAHRSAAAVKRGEGVGHSVGAGAFGVGAVAIAAARHARGKKRVAGARKQTMAKAVGAEARELYAAKIARGRAAREARPRAPYYNPSEEQKAAQAARRAQQAKDSANAKAQRPFRRRPGTPSPWRSHIKAGPLANVAMSGGLAGGAALALHRDHSQQRQLALAKSDHRNRNTALGAVAGAGTADAALTIGGQAAKAHLKRQREKTGVSQHDQKVWAEHKAKFGVNGRSTSRTPGSVKNAMHAAYPKSLPGWKLQRALAFKNRPSVVAATVGGAALTGAAIARHKTTKTTVTKAAPGVKGALTDTENMIRNSARVSAGVLVGTSLRAKRRPTMVHKAHDHAKEGAAAVVGGAAGQGVYQAAGYAPKKYWIDPNTRRTSKHKRLSNAEVKRRDKVLSPNKTKYGMRLPHGHPDRDNVGYHRNYPKQLSYSREIRLLGHTHEGKIGMAVGAASTVAGAAGGAAMMHHHLKKSAEGVAGKVLRAPTKTSEFKRALRGAYTGHRRAFEFDGHPDARKVKDYYKAHAKGHARHSPHSGSFKAGMHLGHAAATAAEHPEVTIPAAVVVGTTPPIIYATHRNRGKTHTHKESTVTKSAFGVEHQEISKLGPPKVHYSEVRAIREKKNNKSVHYNPDTVTTEWKGNTWLLRRPKFEATGVPDTWKPKNGDLVARSPRYRVHHHDANRIVSAYRSNADTVTLTSGATMKHRKVEKSATSAFGVEHADIEKFAGLGGILDAGRDALQGLRHGVGGAGKAVENVAKPGSALANGAKVGTALRPAAMKLKPLVSTPGRAALTGIAAGGLAGHALGSRSNN